MKMEGVALAVGLLAGALGWTILLVTPRLRQRLSPQDPPTAWIYSPLLWSGILRASAAGIALLTGTSALILAVVWGSHRLAAGAALSTGGALLSFSAIASFGRPRLLIPRSFRGGAAPYGLALARREWSTLIFLTLLLAGSAWAFLQIAIHAVRSLL